MVNIKRIQARMLSAGHPPDDEEENKLFRKFNFSE